LNIYSLILDILTDDLDILDELSKHRDNEYLLKKIIFKTSKNPSFISKVKDNKSIYSTHTLARIATYEEFPELLNLLSSNYNITKETREKLSKYEFILQEKNIKYKEYNDKRFNTMEFK